MNTKHMIISAVAALGMTAAASAQAIEDVKISDILLESDEKTLKVEMELTLDPDHIKTTQVMVLTPCIVNGSDSLILKSVGIYGRNRHFFYQRNDGGRPTAAEDIIYRKSETPETIRYSVEVEYREWMDGCRLTLSRTDYGCCEKETATGNEDIVPLFSIYRFKPELIYVKPDAEVVKTRELSGSAFIDFPVSKTEIYTDYRNNKIELAKITGTIDSVKNDRDITIRSLSIKGFASPESPYDNNSRLAKGRTDALKQYVENMYHFGEGFIKTAYEPEDWEGLRRFVMKSDLPHKNEILAEINSDLDPDKKEWRIKSRWKEDYSYLLENCYPSLRHSDYKIEYTIRSYTEPEEIEQVFKTSPQKLSLEEFYLLAQTYEPGSEEINELFETAVRMYPNDKVANLNAANSAIQTRDFRRAERYLEKAGDMPQAIYARGAMEILREDFELAKKFLVKAKNLGVLEAEEALEAIKDRRTIYKKQQ